LKEEALQPTLWRTRFERSCGFVGKRDMMMMRRRRKRRRRRRSITC